MQNVPNIVRERLKAAPLAVDHPDANVLTAFAERSLPDRERSRVLDHLARCGDCRDIVALALPATEPLPAPVTPSPRGWLTWPTLRWGFVAAGVVAIASFGVLQYQRRLQPATMVSAPKQSTPVEVATNDGTKSVAQFSTAPPGQKEKVQAPSTPAVADTLDANATANENAEKKAIAREESTRTRGAMIGSPLPHGPRLANQYQQQNNAQNQFPAPAAPSSFDRLQSFHDNASAAGATPSTAPTPSAVPTLEASTAAPAVAKAKPAMPLPSRADAATNSPHVPDQDARLLRSQIAPGQIGGYVVDPSGAVVANARVTITPTPSKGETATAVTNSQGAWLIAGLPTGNYKAEAQAPGFNTTVLDLNYDAKRPSLYSLTLSPGTVSETVEVSAQAAQVQATTSSATGRAAIGGRNLSQLACGLTGTATSLEHQCHRRAAAFPRSGQHLADRGRQRQSSLGYKYDQFGHCCEDLSIEREGLLQSPQAGRGLSRLPRRRGQRIRRLGRRLRRRALSFRRCRQHLDPRIPLLVRRDPDRRYHPLGVLRAATWKALHLQFGSLDHLRRRPILAKTVASSMS